MMKCKIQMLSNLLIIFDVLLWINRKFIKTNNLYIINHKQQLKMGTLPNWLFSMNYFLIAVFTILSENLFILVSFSLLSVKSLIDNLVFIIEWSNVDKTKISDTHKHIYNISYFDATWISFSKFFSAFFSKSASYLMKSILNVKFIFLRRILMIIGSIITGAIICLLNMAKWSIIWIILWVLP